MEELERASNYFTGFWFWRSVLLILVFDSPYCIGI